MSKDVGMVICKSSVVSSLPCLVAFLDTYKVKYMSAVIISHTCVLAVSLLPSAVITDTFTESDLLITPRRVCASGVKQLVLSVVVVVVVVVVIKKNRKISLMGDLGAKTISKQEDKDEIRRILAYVYLVEQKVVLFLAFPRSF